MFEARLMQGIPVPKSYAKSSETCIPNDDMGGRMQKRTDDVLARGGHEQVRGALE